LQGSCKIEFSPNVGLFSLSLFHAALSIYLGNFYYTVATGISVHFEDEENPRASVGYGPANEVFSTEAFLLQR
jgi:hypothetical protein